MKKYIYYIILFPIFVFANSAINETSKYTNYDLAAYGNYPNYSIAISPADLFTGSGGGGGTISVNNNILTVNFSGGWVQQPLKTGIIKVLTISPALPDIELGPVTTSATSYPNAYNAKIENNSLVIYSTSDVLTGVNTNIIIRPSNYAAGVNYTATLPSIFTCPTGEGNSNGTITIKSGIVTLNMSGTWPSKCNLKTGQIIYLNTGVPIQNLELGMIKQGSTDTNYRARILSNYLVFYNAGIAPPSTTTASLNVVKDLNEGLELLIQNDNSNNWVHGVTYDTKGNVISQARSYFDDLGKGDVTLTKDYVSNKIWGTETTYDNYGRQDKTSFVSPSPFNTFEKTNFFKSSTEIAAGAYPANLPLNNIVASGSYKASQSITATGTVGSGLNVTLTAPNINLGNTFSVTATSGSSFIITAANLPDISVNTSLANYYSDNNIDELYQATAAQPYAQNNYDSLNPGNIINIVGGNKVNGEWKTGYSYTVPAAQEMYYVYGSDYFDGYTFSGKEIVVSKFYKTVTIDPNGNENVTFTDGEGKLLATARSGGAISYPVISLIGTQGFVDVHIPAGIQSSQISLIQDSSLYKAYNLKTGQEITPITSSSFVGGNAYRIVAITPPAKDYDTYVIQSDGRIANENGALGISYNVNYYDYAVNVYNKTGKLIKSIQPNGYISNTTVVPNPAHMTSLNFASTYKYNTLGQLIESSNSDKGIGKIVYKNNGQIRYSQSAIQSDTKVSYTDYDTLGRPIESGVITGSNGIWATAIANPDGALIAGTRSEQIFTIYDFAENNSTSLALPTSPINLTLDGVLTTAGISSTNYIQNNLSGSVAITYTKTGSTISAITWYSYDIYGRSEWIVQYNEGIGAKTIHYEYDYNGNVKKVLFQKDKPSELFVHQYTYNVNDALTKVETSLDNVTFTTNADYNYYKTGELKRVNIAQGLQGIDYVYTLGGQLKSINHPSLEASKDPGGDNNDVFGLTLDYYNGDYLRTGRNIISSPTITGDYSGNIKAARWSNKAIPGDQAAYLYNYNRNNWLTDAIFGNVNSSNATINSSNALTEGGLTYDANGNIKTLRRTNNAGQVIDNLTYSYGNKNQLNQVSDSGMVISNSDDIKNQTDSQNYKYNTIGQLIENVSEKLNYIYNTQGLVTEVKKDNISLVKFYYNERGRRIKKESYNTLTAALSSTTFYELDLSGNTMAVYYLPAGGSISQVDLPVYGLNRLGISNRANIIKYEITDHLGNVRAIIQKESGIAVTKSYADYYPFGERLYGRNSLDYRYAFQGQELDQETGMEAFQLRLWDGRIGRWLTTDPYAQYASPYLGMGNNPVNGIDPNGGFFGWIRSHLHQLFNGGEVYKNDDDQWIWMKAEGNTNSSELSELKIRNFGYGGFGKLTNNYNKWEVSGSLDVGMTNFAVDYGIFGFKTKAATTLYSFQVGQNTKTKGKWTWDNEKYNNLDGKNKEVRGIVEGGIEAGLVGGSINHKFSQTGKKMTSESNFEIAYTILTLSLHDVSTKGVNFDFSAEEDFGGAVFIGAQVKAGLSGSYSWKF